MKLAEKLPVGVVVAVATGTVVPSKVKVTIESGSNPVPVTLTVVGGRTGPEVGLIVMAGEPPVVENRH